MARARRRSTATSRSSTAAGSARFRASSTATRIRPSAATASRSSRCAPAARATRSCTRQAAASSRPSGRRARPAQERARAGGRAPSRLDAARRHDDLRGEVGLRARPRDRARVAARDPGGGRDPDLARRARGPAGARRRRRVPRLRARGGPARGRAARRGGRRLPRARRLRRRAGAALPRGLPRARAWRCGCTATSSRRRARSRSRSSSARARSTTSRRPGRTASPRSPRATSTGVLLPASALFLDRPMPPARALVDAGAAVALATDFNPGSAFCESLPLVCSLAATQLHLSPAEALAACTVNAAHVLGRADRLGRIAPGLRRRPDAPRRARLALPRLPPRRRPRRGRRQGRAVLVALAR